MFLQYAWYDLVFKIKQAVCETYVITLRTYFINKNTEKNLRKYRYLDVSFPAIFLVRKEAPTECSGHTITAQRKRARRDCRPTVHQVATRDCYLDRFPAN